MTPEEAQARIAVLEKALSESKSANGRILMDQDEMVHASAEKIREAEELRDLANATALRVRVLAHQYVEAGEKLVQAGQVGRRLQNTLGPTPLSPKSKKLLDEGLVWWKDRIKEES